MFLAPLQTQSPHKQFELRLVSGAKLFYRLQTPPKSPTSNWSARLCYTQRITKLKMHQETPTGYEPLNTPKKVADNIWIVDGPAISFYGLPYTTRMTIIKLQNGDLFIHSPISLTKDLKKKVAQLGTVRHLVSPNWIHYEYIPQWAKAFSDTIAWASPGVQNRVKKFKSSAMFERNLGKTAEKEWANDIEQMIVQGHSIHKEVVFFHKRSKTLILTDLIENFESSKIPFWFRPFAWLAGVLDPDGKAPIDMRLTFYKGKKELQSAVEKMIAWQPERVVLSHGRWYERDGVKELKRSFRWVLK
ncbi:MAG: hypothetical protein ACI9QC_000866 [Oceanicoccus sp.]